MTDIYLKARTEAALYKALEAAGIVAQGEDGWHVTDGHKYALDVIGTIYKQKLTESVSDPDMIPMEAVHGFHANLRVINASNFDANTIADIVINSPTNPVRGWA